MRGRTAPLALALLLLAGCAPQARELDGMGLVRVLGVDGGGPVKLTAVCGRIGQEEPSRGTAAAADFPSARQALPWAGDKELALTNLSYIIVGMDADLEEVLACVMDDHELSPSATVWLTGCAEELLGEERDPAARMAVLEETGVEAPTAVEVLAELKSDGQTRLPVLTREDGQLEVAGYAAWEGRA